MWGIPVSGGGGLTLCRARNPDLTKTPRALDKLWEGIPKSWLSSPRYRAERSVRRVLILSRRTERPLWGRFHQYLGEVGLYFRPESEGEGIG